MRNIENFNNDSLLLSGQLMPSIEKFSSNGMNNPLNPSPFSFNKESSTINLKNKQNIVTENDLVKEQDSKLFESQNMNLNDDTIRYKQDNNGIKSNNIIEGIYKFNLYFYLNRRTKEC